MDKELKKKRLIYQSAHRGCKETDIILGNFCKDNIEKFSEEDLSQYEEFLNENDWDIYAWLTNKKPFPEKYNIKVINLLKEYKITND